VETSTKETLTKEMFPRFSLMEKDQIFAGKAASFGLDKADAQGIVELKKQFKFVRGVTGEKDLWELYYAEKLWWEWRITRYYYYRYGKTRKIMYNND
jgi:hypothetical protein